MARLDILLARNLGWSRAVARAAVDDGQVKTAEGAPLTDAQKAFLLYEREVMNTRPALEKLTRDWHAAIDDAMAQLAATAEHTLTEARTIGRALLPTTVIGAIFHAAEHASRHTGQIVTTAKLLR